MCTGNTEVTTFLIFLWKLINCLPFTTDDAFDGYKIQTLTSLQKLNRIKNRPRAETCSALIGNGLVNHVFFAFTFAFTAKKLRSRSRSLSNFCHLLPLCVHFFRFGDSCVHFTNAMLIGKPEFFCHKKNFVNYDAIFRQLLFSKLKKLRLAETNLIFSSSQLLFAEQNRITSIQKLK